MTDSCHYIEEYLAVRVSLSEQQRDHVAQCEFCTATANFARSLQDALSHPEPDMPHGLAARMMAGAQTKWRARRHALAWRLVGGSAAVAAVGAVLALVVHDGQSKVSQERAVPLASQPKRFAPQIAEEPKIAEPTSFEDDLAAVLDIEASLQESADWERYQEPLTNLSILAKELEK